MIKIDINTNILSLKLEINEGDFIALSGKSGSGKTTLLRVLAGLEVAKGNIEVNGDSWLSDKVNLAPQKREIGFIFQDYALFTNMSVLKNLLYVKNDIKLATHLLEITELSTMKDRLPSTLSGGQQQRVALCRAMMNKPKLLLMDEPLSALDEQMRTKLQNELLTMHKEFKTTTIMVSHDPSEIYRLASRVVVLEDGKIINDGTPKDVLLRTSGSQKFSFSGQILEIKRVDAIFIAIIAIGQQLVEVVLSDSEAQGLEVSQMIEVSTKAFTPIISTINK
ncbi:ABC transporter ATP-binding protein [Sulfurimonas sp.]|uniref:ABC transporter ATP-binding protein n=1 Tax=Sulfurimonas sp. TaxID=2022749 RepID=UPI002B49092E|nr:ATP-binding cassette domain-containing protein [Sulfurimonas sp.]